MKNILFLLSAISLFSCNSSPDKTQAMQNRIDSLQSRLAQTYKPGLGEFMSSIQVHHAKLWFAGEKQNWPLADFEVDEIKETLEDISTYCTDRPEIQKIAIINPAMDSIGHAIKAKDRRLFKIGFVLLTAACNNCHRASNHAFNVIKTPDTPPLTNQDFTAPIQ